MITSNRNLLVLVKTTLPDEKAEEQEIEETNQILINANDEDNNVLPNFAPC